MRFAGEYLQPAATPVQQKPVVPGFNAEDLKVTPELKMDGFQGPGSDLIRDRYIQHNPGSGVASTGGQEVALAPTQCCSNRHWPSLKDILVQSFMVQPKCLMLAE